MSPTTPTHTILYDRDVGIVLTKDVSASVYGQATRQSSMAPVTVNVSLSLIGSSASQQMQALPRRALLSVAQQLGEMNMIRVASLRTLGSLAKLPRMTEKLLDVISKIALIDFVFNKSDKFLDEFQKVREEAGGILAGLRLLQLRVNLQQSESLLRKLRPLPSNDSIPSSIIISTPRNHPEFLILRQAETAADAVRRLEIAVAKYREEIDKIISAEAARKAASEPNTVRILLDSIEIERNALQQAERDLAALRNHPGLRTDELYKAALEANTAAVAEHKENLEGLLRLYDRYQAALAGTRQARALLSQEQGRVISNTEKEIPTLRTKTDALGLMRATFEGVGRQTASASNELATHSEHVGIVTEAYRELSEQIGATVGDVLAGAVSFREAWESLGRGVLDTVKHLGRQLLDSLLGSVRDMGRRLFDVISGQVHGTLGSFGFGASRGFLPSVSPTVLISLGTRTPNRI